MDRLNVQRREVKDSRYIQGASTPVTVSLYEVCNRMYLH